MPKILKKPALAWEITVTLALKFLLIYVIWLWFFSSPVDEHLDDSQVQTAIFGRHTTDIQPSATNRISAEDN
jgi:hypothetical protein